MKLSFADFPLEYYSDLMLDQYKRFQYIRECGFECIDFNITMRHLEDDYKEQAALLKSQLQELGMWSNQAHAPIVNPFDPQDIDYMQVFERSLEFCQIAGIPQVVIHAGAIKGNTREEYFEKNIEFYRSLIPAAEKTGVLILIENIGHAADDNFLLLGSDLREMVDRLDNPVFAICWDTGHGNLNKQDLYETIITLGDKLTALHLHDNCAYFEPSYRHHRIDMHTFPFATQYTSVNWDALIQGLIDIGYKGTFNFEVCTMTRMIRPKFIRNDEVVRKLEFAPMHLWVMGNKLVYEIGKYMLESYGVFEE